MIPNNNLSVLPWYRSIEEQNARKWWVYGRVYPLYTPATFILPWQIMTAHSEATPSNIRPIELRNAKTNSVVQTLGDGFRSQITKKSFANFGYDVWVFTGLLPVMTAVNNGQYYLYIEIDQVPYYSEIFTVVNDIQPYLKIEWWDSQDFIMSAGTIVYTEPEFKNVIYLQADIAKPEYIFEDEGENRDGYFFPIKQISEKRYRFSFFASEYLLDVMRLIRMSDFVRISKNGFVYDSDTFLITPEWENEGDVAVVQAEFDTATVAKKIGYGIISGGDYNNDFNPDFNLYE